jgi:hypothetical protein
MSNWSTFAACAFVCASVGAAPASAPAQIRLRVVDALSNAPLANVTVRIKVYVRNPACGSGECYADQLDVTSDENGVVTLPAALVGRPAYTKLLISAPHHEEVRLRIRTVASGDPPNVALPRLAPDLQDLRLHLKDAATNAPLSGIEVHVRVNYHQVLCLHLPCFIPPTDWDLTSSATGEVALPSDGRHASEYYESLTVAANHYRPVDLTGKALAAMETITIELRR